MSAIEMRDVRFAYAGASKPVLDGVRLRVEANETALLLGASGAGKSSLALCLNGLIPGGIPGEFDGVVRVAGMDTAAATIAELAVQVGLVFQDPEAQLVTMKVEDEVAFGLENIALEPEEMERRIEEALRQTGLSALRHSRIDKLSGGQKQRLALASVLAMRPSVLVLDEPTANLDPEGTRELFAILRELRASGRYTILLIEHKLDELMEMTDRVLVLGRGGRIAADGSPREVFYRQYDELVQEGVWLPYAVQLAHRLIRRGVPVPGASLTVQETVKLLEAVPLTEEVRELVLHTAAGRKSESAANAAVSAETGANAGIDSESDANAADGAETEIVLEIKPAEFTRDKDGVLKPMHLRVLKGDFLALVGQNGAGKSTLARYMIKLLRAEPGVIYLQGRDLAEWPAQLLTREIGYVFQNPEHQFVTNRVSDELAFGLKSLALAKEEVDARVERMLERFGLAAYADANPFQLSHGEKRRLSTASMLIAGQKLLILDEPTFGQDQRNARQLMRTMKELQESGHTIVIISHDMGMIAEYADHAAVLKAGRLIFHGRTRELFDREELLAEAGLGLPPSIELERLLRAVCV